MFLCLLPFLLLSDSLCLHYPLFFPHPPLTIYLTMRLSQCQIGLMFADILECAVSITREPNVSWRLGRLEWQSNGRAEWQDRVIRREDANRKQRITAVQNWKSCKKCDCWPFVENFHVNILQDGEEIDTLNTAVSRRINAVNRLTVFQNDCYMHGFTLYSVYNDKKARFHAKWWTSVVQLINDHSIPRKTMERPLNCHALEKKKVKRSANRGGTT